MVILVALLLLIGLFQNAASSCPNGWVEHGSQCYHFSHDEEPWGNAEQICELMGGNLLEIETSAENDFITSQLSSYGSKFRPFIALTDLAEENVFVWMVSQTKLVDTGFSNWDSGQPDNGGNENCVNLNQDGEWNDTECDDSHFYICEKPNEDGVNVIG